MFMSSDTRQRIIDHATPLFNEEGYRATTLNQLAQNIGMSRGNLTYHFNDKMELLHAILENLWRRYEKLMAHTTQFPSWESTHSTTLAFHELQQEFSFIFFDRHLLQQSAIKDLVQRIRTHHIQWQLSFVNFSIQIGNMKKETIPGIYENLCRTIWKTSFFWLVSEELETEENRIDWATYVWAIILPHFTAKGISSFQEHFGEEYYQNLGKSISTFRQAYYAG